jgi:hypothetical protein
MVEQWLLLEGSWEPCSPQPPLLSPDDTSGQFYAVTLYHLLLNLRRISVQKSFWSGGDTQTPRRSPMDLLRGTFNFNSSLVFFTFKAALKVSYGRSHCTDGFDGRISDADEETTILAHQNRHQGMK